MSDGNRQANRQRNRALHVRATFVAHRMHHKDQHERDHRLDHDRLANGQQRIDGRVAQSADQLARGGELCDGGTGYGFISSGNPKYDHRAYLDESGAGNGANALRHNVEDSLQDANVRGDHQTDGDRWVDVTAADMTDGLQEFEERKKHKQNRIMLLAKSIPLNMCYDRPNNVNTHE